ncbi:hypothetical protein B9G98_00721 [Wickerhamiella sorbophila]|uniref:Uncharacterized protein n=1 Tax=Wickerhamiella sorbophila TaxID=45607 RepID=A0A2T0FDP6_9ASCO|nr:hypothetical protein B9G98_00721 [Wickerhamiella sorbophila]PRT53101.1 hypothetical protein B9G98_00721 [Wickerhamiella sorbophila]
MTTTEPPAAQSSELAWVLNMAMVETTTVQLILQECLQRLEAPSKLAVTSSKSESHADVFPLDGPPPTHFPPQSMKGTLTRKGCDVNISVSAHLTWLNHPLKVNCQAPLVELSMVTSTLSRVERLLAPFTTLPPVHEFLDAVSEAQKFLTSVYGVLDGSWHQARSHLCTTVPIEDAPGTAVEISIAQEAIVVRFSAYESMGPLKKLVHQESERSPDPVLMAVSAKVKWALNELRHIEHKVSTCLNAQHSRP